MSISEQAAGIGALADPTRRALYEHVVAQMDAVSRESAARAVDVPAHVARFQLDRLVELGLLQVEFRRLTGRQGPGAGRPSKLYRRTTETIAVSLPARRFDLAGHLLARAIERAAGGTPLDTAVREVAHAEGGSYGTRLNDELADGGRPEGSVHDPESELERMRHALAGQGYEPRRAERELVLANCPFHDLARSHTDLVCGMNQAYIAGVAEGLHCHHLDARLHPDPARCCVVITSDDA